MQRSAFQWAVPALICLLLSTLQLQAAAQTNTAYFQNLVVNTATGQLDATYNGPGMAGPGTTITNHGGATMPDPNVNLIMPGWAGSLAPPGLLSQVETAVQNVIKSNYFADLPQYGCGYWINYGGAYVNGDLLGSWNGNSIAGELDNEGSAVAQESWPPSTGNDIFVAICPPGLPLVGESLGGEHWYVVPYNNVWITEPSENINLITQNVAHELAETITDAQQDGASPNNPGWLNWLLGENPAWMLNNFAGANNSSEIVDAGEVTSDTLNGVSVEPYWDAAVDACAIPYGTATGISGNAITSYYNSNDYSNHTLYIGTDQHVHELYWNGSAWAQRDVTQQVWGPNVLGGSSLTSLFDPHDGTSHVFYVGSDRIIHDAYFNGTQWWGGSAYSVDTHQTSTIVGDARALTSCFDPSDNSMRVFYANAASEVVNEMVWTPSSGWQSNPYFSGYGPGTYGGGSYAGKSQLSCSVDSAGNVHVFYIGPNWHVLEAYQVPGTSDWSENDWSVKSGDPTEAVPDAVTSFYDGSALHVGYIGNDNCVHEITRYSNGQYDYSNASASAGDSTAGTGNSLASYWDGVNGHIISHTYSGRIHAYSEATYVEPFSYPSFYYDNWNPNNALTAFTDLTAVANAQAPFTGRSMTCVYSPGEAGPILSYLGLDNNHQDVTEGDVATLQSTFFTNGWAYAAPANVAAGAPLAVP